MPAITESILKQHIKSGEFLPVYFLYGNETYLKQNYALSIANKAVPSMRDFNLIKLSGDGISVQALRDAVTTMPLMAEKKCVLVCDYDIDGAPPKELEGIKELLVSPSEDCILIFWFDRIEINPKRSAKCRAIITLVNKTGCSAELSHYSEGALIKRLCSSAAKRNASMSPEVARRLIQVCGDDLQTLLFELDKLTAYRQNAAITPEDIDSLVTKTVEESVFSLSKAIIAGNSDQAFRILSDLLAAKNEPVALLSVLIVAYADLYRALMAKAEGLHAEQAATELLYPKNLSFRIKNSMAPASRLGRRRIRTSLYLLKQADSRLKGSRMDGRIVLEQTVAELIKIAK